MRERGNEDGRRRRTAPTTPADAEGESGDKEARETAEAAVTRRAGDRDRAGDSDRAGADGHRAKRQRPGIGREEQTGEQQEEQTRDREA
ncbi:hypothetical protein ACFQ71_32270 [Streptomyces sp. NPDC056534]|uniref:hypothetical protein n=1 Tax=Streptomyces sp. NPDC056534 TaxID=3345857 RepID=UPI0036ACACEB